MALQTLADNASILVEAMKYAKTPLQLSQDNIVGTVASGAVNTVVMTSQITLTGNTWANGPKIVDLEPATYLIMAQGLIYRNNPSNFLAYLKLKNETSGADMAGTANMTIDGAVATPHIFSALNLFGFFTITETANVILQGAGSTANCFFRANSGISNDIPGATQISWFKVGP